MSFPLSRRNRRKYLPCSFQLIRFFFVGKFIDFDISELSLGLVVVQFACSLNVSIQKRPVLHKQLDNIAKLVLVACLSYSGQVDKDRPIVLLTLNVLIPDKDFNLFFNLVLVSTEHRDVADDVRDHLLVRIGLLRLHNLDNMSLHNELTLAGDLLGYVCLLCRGFNDLLRYKI